MIYIYGEAHFEKASLDFIAEEIRRIKPAMIFHELVEGPALNKQQIKDHLRRCGENGSACNLETNSDIFELAKEVDVEYLCSFDLSEEEKQKYKNEPLARQFQVREQHMHARLGIIPKGYPSDVVVVVGDAHLRTTKTKQLGDVSPIQILVRQDGGRRFKVVRAQKEFREVE